MSTTPKPSLALRIATLTLAAGSLTALIVQASLSAGCNSSGTTAVPSATPEPPQQGQPPTGTPASAAAAATNPQPELKPGADYLPATKAAPVFHSDDPVAKELKPQPNAPTRNANPALKPGADHFPATKSGFVFDPADRPAPQPPAAQNNAPLQQQAPAQGKNR